MRKITKRLPDTWFVLVDLNLSYGREIVFGAGHYLTGVPNVRLAIGDKSGLDYILKSRKGPVISSFTDANDQRNGLATGYPVVNVSGVSSDAVLPRVTIDNWAVGQVVAEHLQSGGYKNFAWMGLDCWFSELRKQGFMDALSARGFACSILPRPEAIEDKLLRIEKPTAIFVDNDSWARQLIDVCRKQDLHVPVDMAIVGVGNDPIFCETTVPHLSSVDINGEKVGFEAARLVHEMLLGKPAPREPILIPPKGVVVRESSDAVAVDVPALARAVAYIRQHANEGISVAHISTAAHIPRRTLHDLCRKRLNMSISELTRKYRIERAKHLLTETDRTVADVSGSCGYTNTSRFHTIFRRLTGVSPAIFRQQRRLR